MTPEERARDKTHRADWQDYDGRWTPIVENVPLKVAMKAARKFREDNPDLETRVR